MEKRVKAGELVFTNLGDECQRLTLITTFEKLRNYKPENRVLVDATIKELVEDGKITKRKVEHWKYFEWCRRLDEKSFELVVLAPALIKHDEEIKAGTTTAEKVVSDAARAHWERVENGEEAMVEIAGLVLKKLQKTIFQQTEEKWRNGEISDEKCKYITEEVRGALQSGHTTMDGVKAEEALASINPLFIEKATWLAQIEGWRVEEMCKKNPKLHWAGIALDNLDSLPTTNFLTLEAELLVEALNSGEVHKAVAEAEKTTGLAAAG